MTASVRVIGVDRNEVVGCAPRLDREKERERDQLLILCGSVIGGPARHTLDVGWRRYRFGTFMPHSLPRCQRDATQFIDPLLAITLSGKSMRRPFSRYSTGVNHAIRHPFCQVQLLCISTVEVAACRAYEEYRALGRFLVDKFYSPQGRTS